VFRTATYQATHDALTGLINRAEFERRLQRSLERAQRSGLPGALLFMDLDQFKIVNDIAGHDAGDDLLRQIANLYRNEIRERDELARMGGDEFALLADHCSKDEAVSIGQKILESTRNYRLTRAHHTFGIGVSIGIATFSGNSHSTSEVLKLADDACLTAKQNGKNQIVCDAVPAAAGVGRQSDTKLDKPRFSEYALKRA
jgi:diguanylate cyclase (GGDEF)-like protein